MMQALISPSSINGGFAGQDLAAGHRGGRSTRANYDLADNNGDYEMCHDPAGQRTRRFVPDDGVPLSVLDGAITRSSAATMPLTRFDTSIAVDDGAVAGACSTALRLAILPPTIEMSAAIRATWAVPAMTVHMAIHPGFRPGQRYHRRVLRG